MFPIGAMVAGDPFQSLQRTQEAGLDQAGQAALGRGIQQMFQPQMPGAISTSPQGGLFNRIGGALGFGGPPQAQAGPSLSPQLQQATAPYAQPTAPPSQQTPPPPSQQTPPPPAPQPGGGMGPQQSMQPQMGGGGPAAIIGSMSYPQLLQSIIQANPGQPPSVIAHAMKAAQPFMNSMALAQYREQMAGAAQTRAGAAAEAVAQKPEIEGMKEKGRQERFDKGEAGKDARAAVRADIAYQKLDQQRQDAERRGNYQEAQIILRAQHQRAMQLIQGKAASMKPEELQALQQEAIQAYMAAMAKLQQQSGQVKQPPAPGTVPPAAPGTVPPAGSQQPTGKGDRQSSAPQQPVRVQSPQEAQSLPPGTPYITPDGQHYTR